MRNIPRVTASMALAGQTLCVLLVFMPFLLGGVWSNWQYEREATRTRVLSLANALASRQSSLTASTRALLSTLALAPVVRHGNHEELFVFLQELDLNQPDYAGFAVFNASGDTAASVINGKPRQALPPEIVRKRSYFMQVMQERGFSVGGVLELPEQRMVLPMAMPVLNADKEVRGVVLAPLELNALDRTVQDILNGTSERVAIFDRDKQFLYQYPNPRTEAMAAKGTNPSEKVAMPTKTPFDLMKKGLSSVNINGTSEYLFDWNEGNTDFVGAVAELRLTPESSPYMYIGVALPQLSLQRFLLDRAWLTLLGMAGMLVLALVLSRYIGRRYFNNGLEHLVQVALKNQEGDLSVRNGIVTGCREIVLLASVYDGMLSTQEANTNALKNLSHVDPLTGLWNRRRFTEIALQELGRSLRYGHRVALVMADIDKFKNVNDTYGHAAGDEVLRVFARVLHESVRDTDIVARFGGEEFIFLLPEASALNAMAVMEKVRLACAEVKVTYDQDIIRFTSSFGVCAYDPGASELEEKVPTDETARAEETSPIDLSAFLETLIKRADSALYHSKENGRNRVSLWQPTKTVAS